MIELGPKNQHGWTHATDGYVFIERWWWSIKYEKICLHEHAAVRELEHLVER